MNELRSFTVLMRTSLPAVVTRRDKHGLNAFAGTTGYRREPPLYMHSIDKLLVKKSKDHAQCAGTHQGIDLATQRSQLSEQGNYASTVYWHYLYLHYSMASVRCCDSVSSSDQQTAKRGIHSSESFALMFFLNSSKDSGIEWYS